METLNYQYPCGSSASIVLSTFYALYFERFNRFRQFFIFLTIRYGLMEIYLLKGEVSIFSFFFGDFNEYFVICVIVLYI